MKHMLEIPQLLTAKSPAILFSGGKDSVLLLDIARKIRPDIAIIYLHDRLHPQVSRIIAEWDLEVISWPPASQYFIPWGNDLALVSEYSFGNARLPVIRDAVLSHSDCAIEKLSNKRMEYFDYPWSETLWGYRKADERHPVMTEPFPREFDLGPTHMIAPLYSWADRDVLGAIEYRKIPYEPFADEVTICPECRKATSVGSVEIFAKRFGFMKEAA